jgi:hypothetical protein
MHLLLVIGCARCLLDLTRAEPVDGLVIFRDTTPFSIKGCIPSYSWLFDGDASTHHVLSSSLTRPPAPFQCLAVSGKFASIAKTVRLSPAARKNWIQKKTLHTRSQRDSDRRRVLSVCRNSPLPDVSA